MMNSNEKKQRIGKVWEHRRGHEVIEWATRLVNISLLGLP